MGIELQLWSENLYLICQPFLHLGIYKKWTLQMEMLTLL